MNEQYNKYKRYIDTVDGDNYWSNIVIFVSGMFCILMYCFSVYAYTYETYVGIGTAVLSVLLTILAIIGLKIQLKIHKKAKEICKDAILLNGEIVLHKSYISGRSYNTDVKVKLSDGQVTTIRTNYIITSKIMKKYKEYGMHFLKSKQTGKVISLKIKKK